MTELSTPNLLRRLRGSDKAIEPIADNTKLSEVLRERRSSRLDILDAIMTTYSGEAYSEANWQKIYPEWGDTPHIVTLHGHFAEKFPDLGQLNHDLGFLTHLPEFLETFKGASFADYTEANQALRTHLGKKTVYRAMVLSDEEFEDIKSSGIESNILRRFPQSSDPSLEFEAQVLSTYVWALIDEHYHQGTYFSPLVSVSEYENVAIAIGSHIGRSRLLTDPETKLYLFKISVPEADIVHYTEHAARMPSDLESLANWGARLRISVDGAQLNYDWDRMVESFVMYKINPGEIVDAYTPDVKCTSWNGRVTEIN